MTKLSRLFLLLSILLFASCSPTIPKGAKAVENFITTKYLGTWYEIARFDFYFEKNLNQTTATYSLNQDGSIRVDNKGFDTSTQKWKQSIGKAKFVKDDHTAMLKVSFFGPFYGGYNVIALDSDYQYALVSGGNLEYLWILSRTKTIPESVKLNFVNQAKSIGFDTSKLIWVQQ